MDNLNSICGNSNKVNSSESDTKKELIKLNDELEKTKKEIVKLKRKNNFLLTFGLINLSFFAVSAILLGVVYKEYYKIKNSDISSTSDVSNSTSETNNESGFSLSSSNISIATIDGVVVEKDDCLQYPGQYLYTLNLAITNNGSELKEKPVKIVLAKMAPINTEDYYVGTSYSMFLNVSSPNPYSLDYLTLEPNETKTINYVIPAKTLGEVSRAGIDVVIEDEIVASDFHACIENDGE